MEGPPAGRESGAEGKHGLPVDHSRNGVNAQAYRRPNVTPFRERSTRMHAVSRRAVSLDAGPGTPRAGGPLGRALLALLALALAACRGKAIAEAPPPAATGGAGPGLARVDAAREVSPGIPPVDPRQQARIAEAQHIIADGAAPDRLARFISDCAGERACDVARRMALGALRTGGDRAGRLAALIEAGRAAAVRPEDDPLWPDLVQSLSETWAAANSAAGRRRMLHERDPRTRLLLAWSLAVYAASNRGLSDLTIPQRRVLRAEFMRLYPTLPAPARAQVDAFVARIDVNARGTL